LEGNKEIMVTPSSISLLGLGTLKVENTTGNMKETSVLNLSGDINIDKIQEDTSTNTTNYILSGGFFTIGDDFTWGGFIDNEDLQGQLTLSPSMEEEGML
jgi:hypothetical protein